jgi:very-short-patch-repair endonuclease
MDHDEFLRHRAREMRHDPTPAERILWGRLRNRRFAGIKVRRQHPIAGFIVDFYAPECAVVIELDGETHIGKEGEDRDRDEALQRSGLTVLRFWNTAIYEDLECVLEAIFRTCNQPGTSAHAPSPRPSPPRTGERE